LKNLTKVKGLHLIGRDTYGGLNIKDGKETFFHSDFVIHNPTDKVYETIFNMQENVNHHPLLCEIGGEFLGYSPGGTHVCFRPSHLFYGSKVNNAFHQQLREIAEFNGISRDKNIKERKDWYQNEFRNNRFKTKI